MPPRRGWIPLPRWDPRSESLLKTFCFVQFAATALPVRKRFFSVALDLFRNAWYQLCGADVFRKHCSVKQRALQFNPKHGISVRSVVSFRKITRLSTYSKEVLLSLVSAPLCLLVCSSIVFSGSSRRRVGYIPVDGLNTPVFREQIDGTICKYVEQNGTVIDVREIIEQELTEKRQKYGKMAVRLYNALQSKYSGDLIEVELLFHSPLPTEAKTGLDAARESSYSSAIAAIDSALGIPISSAPRFHSNPEDGWIRAELTREQVLALKHLDEIDAMFLLDDRSAPLSVNMDDVYGTYTDGGLNISSLSPHGDGYEIGVVEPGKIETNMANSWLNGIGLNIRTGDSKTGNPTRIDSHSVYVTAMISNSVGDSNSLTRGGAWNADAINFASVGTSGNISTIRDAYQWVMNQGSRVVNSSWRVNRWYSGSADTLQNEIDWYLDRWTNSEYVFFANSAGNSAEGTPAFNDCISHGWDSTDCERSASFAHGIVSVGSINKTTSSNYSVSSFSSWRDGPTFDEVPHVVAIGNNVSFPWSTYPGWNPGSATSFSSAAVAALALDLISRDNNGLDYYPEIVKAVLMTSASYNLVDGSWPKSGSSDKKGGAGLPYGYVAGNMIGNRTSLIENDTVNTTAFNCASFHFSPSEGDGTTKTFYIKVNHTRSCDLTMLITWNSDPDHVVPGETVPIDDVDLTLNLSNGSYLDGSYSSNNTAERVTTTHNTGYRTYEVEIDLYNRLSDGYIYGGIAWCDNWY